MSTMTRAGRITGAIARLTSWAPSPNTFIQNPYPYFAWMRRISPVLRVNLWGIKGWLVTGQAETDALLKDGRFVRDRRLAVPASELPTIPPTVQPAYDLVTGLLLNIDGPDHTRIRRLVTKAFTPRVVATLEHRIDAISSELLDARAGHTEHELINDYASLLPLRVITTLLGMAAEDASRIRHWTEQTLRAFDLRPAANELDDWIACAPDILAFKAYIEASIDERRRAPGPDLLTDLIAVRDNNEARLSTEELVATVMLLFMAGHETAAHLITSGYRWLLAHPDQYAMLKARHADAALMATAIDEMLRFDPPALLTSRYATEDVMFLGRRIARGDIVIVSFAAANRDPRAFARPNCFDITRSPNRHMSFSAGAHYCLGAILGKLEAQVAIRALITRLDNPTLLEAPVWRRSIAIRGYESLKIRALVAQ